LADEVDNLLDFERINRVVFGARVMHRREGADASATVMAVRPGTPADGKLQVGDRIREINGRRVEGIVDFACWMLDAQPGREIRLRGRRGDRPLAVSVRLRPRPRPDGAKLAERHFGLSLRAITPRLARALGVAVERGLLVTGVEEGGPAHRVGIRPRDVLFQVGPSYVRSLEDLGSALEDLPAGGRVRVGILRRNMAAWVTLRARRAEGNRL
jgi:S1-C subfamily serine protease